MSDGPDRGVGWPQETRRPLTDGEEAADQALQTSGSTRDGPLTEVETKDGDFEQPEKPPDQIGNIKGVRFAHGEGTRFEGPEIPPDQPENPDEAVDSPDRVTSKYNPEDAAREDLRELVAALDEASGQLAVLSDALRQQLSEMVARAPDLEEQLDLAEQLAPQVSQLKSTVTEIGRRGLDQDPDLAFSATVQTKKLVDKVKRAKKRFSATRAWTEIREALKSAATALWSLISHLVKVKEWSVTGQVSTGVLGLAQASISVTFGQ